MDNDFGAIIRRMRRERGWNQDELAERSGLSRVTVAKYETYAKKRPAASTVAAIARAFGVSVAVLMGEEPPLPSNAYPVNEVAVPILGAIRCGPGGLAEQEVEGYGSADVANPEEHFLLRVVGDSMEPDITEGMLALIHRQEDVECGEVAAVGIDGEEGTLKRVVKQDGAVILQAFNNKYAPRVFAGREMRRLTIFGKLVETRRRW